MEKEITNYLRSRVDHFTAWIGIAGIILQILNMQSMMFILFVLLLVAPEASIVSTIRTWAAKAKAWDEKNSAHK